MYFSFLRFELFATLSKPAGYPAFDLHRHEVGFGFRAIAGPLMIDINENRSTPNETLYATSPVPLDHGPLPGG